MNVSAQLNYSHGYFLKFPHTCCLSLSFILDNESSMKWKAIKLIPATLKWLVMINYGVPLCMIMFLIMPLMLWWYLTCNHWCYKVHIIPMRYFNFTFWLYSDGTIGDIWHVEPPAPALDYNGKTGHPRELNSDLETACNCADSGKICVPYPWQRNFTRSHKLSYLDPLENTMQSPECPDQSDQWSGNGEQPKETVLELIPKCSDVLLTVWVWWTTHRKSARTDTKVFRCFTLLLAVHHCIVLS